MKIDYCSIHNRDFYSEDVFHQHCDAKDCDEFCCEDHPNKTFYSRDAYMQHMESLAHYDYENEEEEEEEYDVEEEYQEDEYDEFLDSIPKPEGFDGYWVYHKDFTGKKSFGYFICYCKNRWMSAHAFKKYKQGCKKCEAYKYPVCLWVNENKRDNDSELEGSSPHDRERCEACRAGECIDF